MGVSHLGHHAAKAQANQVNNGAPDAKQIGTPLSTRFAANSAANNVPKVGAVHALSKKALRPGNTASQPEHGGARAGMKMGQAKNGMKLKNAYPLSGGRAG